MGAAFSQEHQIWESSLSLRHILRNVDLSFEQLTKLCGLSRRQLSYWIQNGFVPAPDKDPVSTLEWAILIKHNMRHGDTLRQAAQRTENYHEEYGASLRRLQEMSDDERGQQLARDIEGLRLQVSNLQQAIADPANFRLPLRNLTKLLCQLSLDELLTLLPHSRPTPDIVIRVQQSSAVIEQMIHRHKPENEVESPDY